MAKGIAFHIGVNVVDSKHYNGWSGPLAACVNDAEAMYAIAQQQSFDATIVRTEEATRDTVIAAVSDAADALTSGDIFLLTYAGHGGQVRDISGDEPDNHDETWCLYDGQLVDDELDVLWRKFADGVRVLVLSDSCHSGTVTRSAGMDGGVPELTPEIRKQRYRSADAKLRYMSGNIARGVYRSNQNFYDDRQRVAAAAVQGRPISAAVKLISGCQDNQFSSEQDGNGLFTRALMEIWDGGAFTGSYHQLHAAIVARLSDTAQTPNYRSDGQQNTEFDTEPVFTIS